MNHSLFRIRVVLEPSRDVKLHARHEAVIHALLAAAWGVANDCPGVMPDGLLLEAPEQSRVHVAAGSRFAFGFTVFGEDGNEAAERVQRLIEGLRIIGRKKAAPKTVFGGNYQVAQTEDIVARQPLKTGSKLRPIPNKVFNEEISRVENLTTLTLRFRSPLLAERPKNLRDGGQFMDRNWFGPATLFRRLAQRLVQLGFVSFEPDEAELRALEVEFNQLVWLTFSYGPHDRRKPKYGALGRVRIANITPEVARILVLGQYVHVGGALRFGFGRYRLEELGTEPFPCCRAVSLEELAFVDTRLDQLASELDIPSGIMQAAIRTIETGEYKPDEHSQVVISSSTRRRTLSIPSKRDRALQRCIHDLLAPAIDRLLEESSLAYRSGFGVHHAASRLKQAVSRGFGWALKADFREFFDSIPHQELAQRLDAWIGDDSIVSLIMKWVKQGSLHSDRGIPTGASISPLIANLFLDSFDEAVESAGGFLVRYADDFLILYRSREEANRSRETAAALANEICLELNDAKTATLDLREPFEFLGYRFTLEERWEFNSLLEPIHVRDLGWEKKTSSPKVDQLHLPGESNVADAGDSTIICGPNVRRLDFQGKKLVIEFDDGTRTSRLPVEQIRELVLIDAPEISGPAIRAMSQNNISWSLIDSFGNSCGTFIVNDPMDSHVSVLAQVEAAVDPKTCLVIARNLVSAKLENYAALARTLPGRFNDFRTPDKLRKLARQSESADSLEQLLGIEGAGAAQWYGNLSGRLTKGFSFDKRVAPRASDPVNAMLNLGQTILYNYVGHMIQLVGLVPATGLLHTPRSGHAALASDMQEPFRHLVDRAVLESLRSLQETDFSEDADGPYPIMLKPRAIKLLVANLHRILALNCQSRNQAMPKPYRLQVVTQIRSLRQFLISHGETSFRPFTHP